MPGIAKNPSLQKTAFSDTSLAKICIALAVQVWCDCFFFLWNLLPLCAWDCAVKNSPNCGQNPCKWLFRYEGCGFVKVISLSVFIIWHHCKLSHLHELSHNAATLGSCCFFPFPFILPALIKSFHSLLQEKKCLNCREQQFRHLHCALLHTFSQALQALPLRNAVVSKMYTRDQKCAGQWCCQKKKNFLAQPDHLNPTNLLQCLQLQVGTAVLTFRLHAKALRKFFSFFVPLGCILLNTGAHSEQQLWFRHAPHLSSLQPEWSVNVFVSWECSRQRGKRKKEPEVLLWRLCHCQWLSTSAPK